MDTLLARRNKDLEEAPFLGREAQLQRLEAHMRNACLGHGGLILLEAESGTGKSRLLREFQKLNQRPAFFGQAKVNSAHRPFELLGGVVEGVVQLADRNPAFAQGMGRRLGGWRSSLMTVFPTLAVLFPGETFTHDMGAQGEEASVRALVAFAGALGDLLKGALVVLDDCQWSDDLTMRFVAHWQSQAAAAKSRLMLVAAYRGSELPATSKLRAAKALDHIKLSPLRSADVCSMVEQIAGPAEPEVTALIEKLCHGNPFMVITVTRGFLETNLLVERNGLLALQSSELERTRLVGDAARFLRKRIELLPPKCIEALRIAAFSGREFDLQVVAGTCHETLAAVRNSIEAAVHRGIVQESSATNYIFAHDKLREIVLELTPPEEARRLHLAIARHLAEKSPTQTFAIAFHFDASGNAALALPYALAAAKEARARHSLEAAEHQYRIAWRAVSSVSGEMRQQIAAGLGEVLLGRSYYEEALNYLHTARALTSDIYEKSRIDIKIGKVHTYRASPQEALAAYEQGLALFGYRINRGALLRKFAIIKGLLVQLAHTVFPRFFVGRKSVKGNEREIRIADLLNQTGYPLYFECRLDEILMTHFTAFNTLESYKATPEICSELCFSYAGHGVLMACVPYFSRAIAFCRQALELGRRMNDSWSTGLSCHFLGVVLLAASRYDQALHYLLEARRIYNKLGYVWDEDMVRCNVGFTLYRLGNLKEAEKELLLTINDSTNIQVVSPSLSYLAKLKGGCIPEQMLNEIEEEALRADVQTIVGVKEARGIWYLARGEYAKAVAVMVDGWDLIRARRITQEYVVALPAWVATAMRMGLEAGKLGTEERKKALKVAKAAARLSRKFKNNLAHSLREVGLLYALMNQRTRARAALDKSIAAAERLGQRYEAAQSLLARGRTGQRFGWHGAEEEIELATQRLLKLGAPCGFHGIEPSKQPAVPETMEVGAPA